MKKNLKQALVLSQVFANVNTGIKRDSTGTAKLNLGRANLIDALNDTLQKIGCKNSDQVCNAAAGSVNLSKAVRFPKVDNIMDTIKTFKDVLAYVGETQEEFDHRTQFDTDQQKADKEIELWALALNEGKVMTLEEEGWWPYFRNDRQARAAGSGSGFSFGVSACADDCSSVGARLRFKSKSLSDYAGRTATETYYRAHQ